jgi:hypothetical protein
MKILKWFLVVLAVLVVIIGPYTLVYEEYTGPYSGTGKVIQRVYDGCTLEGVMTEKGFGIYLNDPKTTDPNKLRSEIGCVLEGKDLGKAWRLRRRFKIKEWRGSDCLVAEFPIRNNLSYMIGPFKAYPELNKAMIARKAKLGACMELYDMPARKTLYIFQLKK